VSTPIVACNIVNGHAQGLAVGDQKEREA